MSAGAPLLRVSHLSVSYGDLAVVDDVSFSVASGEILGIAGESGSGKSTLAHAIARTLPPPSVITQGSVKLDGTDLLQLDFEAMQELRWRDVAIIFQSAMNALNPLLKVKEQITDVLRARGADQNAAQQRAAELFDLVDVGRAHLDSYPHQLSGGMRQRVVIAIALALNPKLLLMDEPTTALDVLVQQGILSRVLELQQRLGFAIVFITHDLELLFDFADRLLVLYAGRIAELGTVEQVRRAPRHPYTKGLLDATPSLTEPTDRLQTIGGLPPSANNMPGGCRFHPRCQRANDSCPIDVPPLRRLSDGRLLACHEPLP